MTGDSLLGRLETEREQAQHRIEQLRNNAAQIEKQLAALEEKLEHLEITRRTLTKILEETEESDNLKNSGGETSRAGRKPTREPHAEYGDVRINSASLLGGDMPPHQRKVPLFEQPPLGPVSRRIQVLVCSSDQPLTPKDVTQSLGRNADKRTNVESVRAALEKLASKGHLTKIGPGLFSAPQRHSGSSAYA